MDENSDWSGEGVVNFVSYKWFVFGNKNNNKPFNPSFGVRFSYPISPYKRMPAKNAIILTSLCSTSYLDQSNNAFR